MPKRRSPAPRAPKVPARFRALGGVDPRKLPPGTPYPCGDALVGQRARGKRLAGVVQSCAVPPAGSRGPHYALGNVVSGSEIGRAWRSSAREAEALDARYSGPDFDLRRKRAPKARTAAPSPAPAAPRPAVTRREELPLPLPQGGLRRREVSPEGLEIVRGFDELSRRWGLLPSSANTQKWLTGLMVIDGDLHVYGDALVAMGVAAALGNLYPSSTIRDVFRSAFNDAVRVANLAQMAQADRAPVVVDVKPVPSMRAQPVTRSVRLSFTSHGENGEHFDVRAAQGARLTRAAEIAAPMPKGGLRRQELPLPLPEGGLPRPVAKTRAAEGYSPSTVQEVVRSYFATGPIAPDAITVLDRAIIALMLPPRAGDPDSIAWTPRDPSAEVPVIVYTARNSALTKRRAVRDGAATRTTRAAKTREQKNAAAALMDLIEGTTQRLRTLSIVLPVGMFPSDSDSGEKATPTKRAAPPRALPAAPAKRREELPLPLPKGGLRRAELPLPLPPGGLPRPKDDKGRNSPISARTILAGGRERWPEGHLVALAGEQVRQRSRGWFGLSTDAVRGVVEPAKSNSKRLMVRVGKKTYKLDSTWVVEGDTTLAEIAAAREKKEDESYRALRAKMDESEAADLARRSAMAASRGLLLVTSKADLIVGRNVYSVEVNPDDDNLYFDSYTVTDRPDPYPPKTTKEGDFVAVKNYDMRITHENKWQGESPRTFNYITQRWYYKPTGRRIYLLEGDTRTGHASRRDDTRGRSAVSRREELPIPLPKGGLRRAELPLPLPQGGLPMPRPMPRPSTVARREELAAPLPPGGLGKKSMPLPEEMDAPACPPKITVRWIAPRWVATGNTYNAKDTLRSWGFKWMSGLGAWATDDPAVAMKARKCMDPASRVEVERRAKVATPIPEAPKGPQYTMTYEDGYWIVRGNTRDIYKSLKDAGWRAFKRGEQWDGWRTDRPEIANSLRNAATDDALVALDAALQERDNILALSRAANEEDLARIKPGFTCADIPVPPGLSYRPYQCVGIVYAANRPGVLIGDEPGLGKTIQAIGVVNVDPTIERVLVICPASLRNVWRDHFELWTVRPTSIYVARNAKAPIPEHANVVILGFQAAVTRKGEETPAAYADAMKQQWDLLIVDEGHFLKNPEAKRTQAILGVEKYDKAKKEVIQVKEGLAHRARRKVFLTGTPLPNRPLEMWPLLHALAPKEFKSWGQYAYRYTNVEETKYGVQFKGSRNEAELNERMRTHVMIRRLKVDVLKDLPPKQRVIVPFDPEIGRDVMRRLAEGEYAKMLEREARRGISSEDELLMDPEELLERWMSELKEAAAEMRGQNLDLAGASVAMGPKAKIAFSIMAAMRRDLAVAKIPSLIDYVSGILEEKPKVVIMAHHREVQDALVSALVKHLGSAEAVVLHRGGMADKDKSEAERRFQTDPKVRVFVGSIMASGVGITLTAADQLVMAEIDWVPANNAQAEDRIHRIGQTLPATIHYPLVDGSIEAKLIRTCVEKLNIADRILDDDVRTKMLRDPITSPALRPPQNTLETWAFETMVSVVKNPPPRIGWRDMNFAREVAASPYLTDRRWRAAIATAIRLTGGSASRFDAKFGVPTRPPATQLEAWAGRAMTLLADLDSDRAEVRNGEGFSKSDGGEGHALAAMARLGQMSDADWQDAIRLAKRYKRQVGEFRATPDGEQRENPGRGRRRPATPPRRRFRR